MDDTPLYLCLWVNCLYGFLKTSQPVHTEKQDILYAAVFQVIKHPKPEFAALVGAYSNAEYFLVAIRCDTKDNISGPAQYPSRTL